MLSKSVLGGFAAEGNIHPAVKSCIVLGKANIVGVNKPVPTLKLIEIPVDEGACYLPCSVVTEVEKDYAVIILDSCQRLSACVGNNRGQHELIGQACVIRGVNGFIGRFIFIALAIDHGGISLFYAVIVIIPVHCIVTAGNGCNFAAVDA